MSFLPWGAGDTRMDSDAANLSDIQSEILDQELPRDYHFMLIKLFHDQWSQWAHLVREHTL
jgi:hypothetical protein